MTKYTQVENISAFLDGEMSDSEARRFLAEIAEDPSAAAELQRMLKLRELIADAMAPEGAPTLRLPVEMQQRWQAAIHEQAGRATTSATAPSATATAATPRAVRPKPNFWRAAVPMAATVLVAAGVLWMFNRAGSNKAEAPAASPVMASLPPEPPQVAMNQVAPKVAAGDSKLTRTRASEPPAANALLTTAAAPDQENDVMAGAPAATPPPAPPLLPAPRLAQTTAMQPLPAHPQMAPAAPAAHAQLAPPAPSAIVQPVLPQTAETHGAVAERPGRIAPNDPTASQNIQPDAAGGQANLPHAMTAQTTASSGPAAPAGPATPVAPVSPAPSPAPVPSPAIPSPAATAAAPGGLGTGSFGAGGTANHGAQSEPPVGTPATVPAPRPGALAEMTPGAMAVQPDVRDDQAAGTAGARLTTDAGAAPVGGMPAPTKPAIAPPNHDTALADAGTPAKQADQAVQAALNEDHNRPNVQEDMDIKPAGGMTAEAVPTAPPAALQKGVAEGAVAADSAPAPAPAPAPDTNLNIIHIPYNAQNVALIRSWVEKHAGSVRLDAVPAPGEPLAGPAFLGYVKENEPRTAETTRLEVTLPAAEMPALQAYTAGFQAPTGDTPVARTADQPAAATLEIQIQSSQNDNNANK